MDYEKKYKENDDERIRQFLIHEVTETSDKIMSYRNMSKKDVLAWLEKQGEQKPAEWHREDEQNLNACLGYIPDEFLRRWLTDIIHVKYDKLADKVEPKFRIEAGKWYICISQYCNCIGGRRYQALSDGRIIDDFGTEYDMHNDADKYFRLWSIEDAKDGDILFQDLMGGKTFIYNGVNPDMAILYSFIISNDGEDVLPYHIGKPNTGIGNIEENKNIIHPATKEQRDLLFQKMHEAGYEWNAEKKELKKIEQKPVWSEEDERIYRSIMCSFAHNFKLTIQQQNFVKSLKDRYTWKPSEEQMEALLYEVNAWDEDSINGQNLKSLYQDLKKLRGE